MLSWGRDGMSARFVDQVKVRVKAGDGGSGCVAFRREKYVPRGGPSGGDGGRGGSVIFEIDPGTATLYDFRYKPHLKAGNGGQGMGDKRAGKAGQDLIVKVPPGTVVRCAETGDLIADLTFASPTVVVAKGGRGGRGNARFASSVNRAPRKFEEGLPGEERVLELELKSIADVGLVGLPNAGKSTLLRAVSNAVPEVAPYPFTTLVPHLGVVDRDDLRFVVADIPGLIEGASEGKGLGHEFLRHVERTQVLLYVVDAGGDPVNDFVTLRRELFSHSEDMKRKKYILALNKTDLLDGEEILRLSSILKEVADADVYPISALETTGIQELVDGILGILPQG